MTARQLLNLSGSSLSRADFLRISGLAASAAVLPVTSASRADGATASHVFGVDLGSIIGASR